MISRDAILSCIAPPGGIERYAREYYDIMLLYFLLNLLMYVLAATLVADGGEKLAAVANVTSVALNVALSILFVGPWGIRGIAIATVLSRLVFLLLVSIHFFGKKNTLRLCRHWKWADGVAIVKNGVVLASTYALEALTIFAIHLFAVLRFDNDTRILLVMLEKFLGILAMFLGMALGAQPLIGTLNGEKNKKVLRYLIKVVCHDLTAVSLALTLLTFAFAPFLVRAFGIGDAALLGQGTVALRIVCATLVSQTVLVCFFALYYMLELELLAFTVSVFRSLISPLMLAVALSLSTGSPTGIYVGLAAAPVVSILACTLGICRRYGRDRYLFVISRDMDDNTFIYDFEISPENAAAMSHTANEVLRAFSVSERVRMLVGVFIEDTLLLVLEKNAGRAKLDAECTIIVEDGGVRLILRDSGVIFNITDGDAPADSFRQYVVANMMVKLERKANITTIGYNRNELFFDDPRTGA